jgi:hypothetical protein
MKLYSCLLDSQTSTRTRRKPRLYVLEPKYGPCYFNGPAWKLLMKWILPLKLLCGDSWFSAGDRLQTPFPFPCLPNCPAFLCCLRPSPAEWKRYIMLSIPTFKWHIYLFISYFSVAVIKHHDQSTIWKKGLFGLMVPKSKSPSWWKRLGSKWQAWGQEQKTADAHPQHKA